MEQTKFNKNQKAKATKTQKLHLKLPTEKENFKEPTRAAEAATIDGAIREVEKQLRSFLFQVEKMMKKTYHLLLCTIIDTKVYMKILNIYIFKLVEA